MASRKRHSSPQYCITCENCGREIVGMSGHWKCPYCGWNNPHRKYGNRIGYTDDDCVGTAFVAKVPARTVRLGVDGQPVVPNPEPVIMPGYHVAKAEEV
jgi:hypothetical protein